MRVILTQILKRKGVIIWAVDVWCEIMCSGVFCVHDEVSWGFVGGKLAAGLYRRRTVLLAITCFV